MSQLVSAEHQNWYYFLDGQIVGPTDIMGLFTLPLLGDDGRPVLIRQHNIGGWHPIIELSSLATPLWRVIRFHARQERRDFLKFVHQKFQELQAQKKSIIPKRDVRSSR